MIWQQRISTNPITVELVLKSRRWQFFTCGKSKRSVDDKKPPQACVRVLFFLLRTLRQIYKEGPRDVAAPCACGQRIVSCFLCDYLAVRLIYDSSSSATPKRGLLQLQRTFQAQCFTVMQYVCIIHVRMCVYEREEALRRCCCQQARYTNNSRFGNRLFTPDQYRHIVHTVRMLECYVLFYACIVRIWEPVGRVGKTINTVHCHYRRFDIGKHLVPPI